MENLRPAAATIAEEEARDVLGGESRVFSKWGEVVACRYTSYDLYHTREGQSAPSKTFWTIISFPFFLIQAPIFGLPELVEAEFSSGRTWYKEFRRHWLWFVPLHGSPANEYAQSLIRLHGRGTAPPRR